MPWALTDHMEQDPGSLSNLRDIVTPSPAPWWPLAPGWYVLIAIFAIALVIFVVGSWKRWKLNAYRRDALGLLPTANTAAEIASILKRTALAAFPRSEVASLTGDAWCDWLEAKVPGPISASAREKFARSVFANAEADLEEMRRYAVSWVREHRTEETAKGGAPC